MAGRAVQPIEDGGEQTPENISFQPSKAYATRKTVAQGALDFALLLANSSQLKALVDIPGNSRSNFYHAILTLLFVSIVLQVGTGLLLVILAMSNPKTKKGHARLEHMNNASVCLILLITVVNIFISAFGINFVDTANKP